jgi:hypothetical protein
MGQPSLPPSSAHRIPSGERRLRPGPSSGLSAGSRQDTRGSRFNALAASAPSSIPQTSC